MDSLLVGIPHSIDCDGAVNASLMLTCETPPLAGCPIHTGGRLRQNGGRHQIGMLDGIRSEPWTPSGQNAWTASVRIRKHMSYAAEIAELQHAAFSELVELASPLVDRLSTL
jgi:hypothetical protein